MKRPRMFVPGNKIASLDVIWSLISDGKWIWIRHKAYAPGWIMSRTMRSLALDCEAGEVFYARVNPRYEEWDQKRASREALRLGAKLLKRRLP